MSPDNFSKSFLFFLLLSSFVLHKKMRHELLHRQDTLETFMAVSSLTWLASILAFICSFKMGDIAFVPLQILAVCGCIVEYMTVREFDEETKEAYLARYYYYPIRLCVLFFSVLICLYEQAWWYLLHVAFVVLVDYVTFGLIKKQRRK